MEMICSNVLFYLPEAFFTIESKDLFLSFVAVHVNRLVSVTFRHEMLNIYSCFTSGFPSQTCVTDK
jgi:hypothetical protein